MVKIFYLYDRITGSIHNNAFTKYESAIEELKEIGGAFDLGIADVKFAKRSICFLQRFEKKRGNRKRGDEKVSTHDIHIFYSCAQELYEESEDYNRIWNELMDADPNHLESYEPGNMFVKNRLPFHLVYTDNNATSFHLYDEYGCRINHIRVIHN